MTLPRAVLLDYQPFAGSVTSAGPLTMETPHHSPPTAAHYRDTAASAGPGSWDSCMYERLRMKKKIKMKKKNKNKNKKNDKTNKNKKNKNKKKNKKKNNNKKNNNNNNQRVGREPTFMV
ncbi:hypothetical protein PAMA_007169 [Pampus argenteus]